MQSKTDEPQRETIDVEAIAVGSLAFAEKIKGELGSKALRRGVEPYDGAYALREPSVAYSHDLGGKNEPLRLENTIFWDENTEAAESRVKSRRLNV